MKVKYKYIKNMLLEEEKCIEYLESMSLKGWKLTKIGQLFFKFKQQEPKALKYQMDYNELSTDYLDVLTMDGYELIDNYRQISIFCNENVYADDLHTDNKTRLITLKNIYKLAPAITLIICAYFIYMLSGAIGVYRLLVRNTIGSYLINLNMVLSHYIYKTIAIAFLLMAIIQLLIRWNINRQLEDKQNIDGIIKIAFLINNIVAGVLFVGVGLLLINVLADKPYILLGIFVSLVLFFCYSYYVNKIAYREASQIKRRIKIILAVVVFVGIDLVINSIDINNGFKKSKIVKSEFQTAKVVENESENSLFISYNSIYGIDDLESRDVIFYEVYYTCLNNYCAKEVFKEWICEDEKQTRIPSEEEIDQIVKKTGEWSTNDVPYLSYKQALKKYKPIESDIIDLGYYFDNQYIMLKDNHVLRVKVKDNVDINELIKYYFK